MGEDAMTVPASGPRRVTTVHVLVTCTSRKTVTVPAEFHLGSLANLAASPEVVQEWTSRLSAPYRSATVAAEDLYAGEHWAIVRHLPASAPMHDIRLWVCSAGYGLIPAHALIRPYAAAFSGHDDRVPGGADGARWWWQALAQWEGPDPAQPRSIRELAAAHPTACFMLALSASYLAACRDDIAAAAAELHDPDRLLVISAGARRPGLLAGLIVPADARLQAVLGGTRQALNARIAAHLLRAGITGRAQATRHMTDLLALQPPVARYERKKLSDEEVTSLISGRLAQEPGMPASRMLREFRDAGYACEQQRFAELHRQVAGGGR
jgi:hypothetical protein